MKFSPIVWACVVGFTCAPVVKAQDHDHSSGDAAVIGKVNFPISCAPEAQAPFNHTVALLYSFFWERIDAAVAAVLKADPNCAMAYWAKAVASLDNALGSPPTTKLEQAGWAAVENAKRLGAKTPREREYIEAVEVVFKDYQTIPFQQRAIAYEKALERLHTRYPQDAEAAILYAFWLQVTADRNDQTFAQQLKSASILEKELIKQPEHPGIAHFLIHAYDFPAIADRGLDAARRYASIAPDSPHALHMPSHIFSRVGEWQDSIAINARSRGVAKQDRDVYHALDYMVYAALQLGRDRDVREWVEFVNTAGAPNEETRQIAYAGAAIPARYALERGDWQAAAKLELRPARTTFNWAAHPEGEAVNAYARGLGAARSGDATAAEKEISRLETLIDAMRAQKKDYWVEQGGIQKKAVAAWAANAEGRHDEAIQMLREAADQEDRTEKHIMMPGRVIPVREMLGELLLEQSRPADALKEFERSQRADPKRFRNVYGEGRAAALLKDQTRAKAAYGRLVAAVGSMDSDRKELRDAREYLDRPSQ